MTKQPHILEVIATIGLYGIAILIAGFVIGFAVFFFMFVLDNIFAKIVGSIIIIIVGLIGLGITGNILNR